MRALLASRASRAWLVVTAVGVLVVAIVLCLSLIPRLHAGQDVLDGLEPAFTPERVIGARAGINLVSQEVDVVGPLATRRQSGAREVTKLIGLVSKKTGLSRGEVASLLRKETPHTAALLAALPLSGVTAELPGLISFLAKAAKLSPAQLGAALEQSFPGLNQTIGALPTVTKQWNDVKGTENLTRFDGTPVNTAFHLRDYFSEDVVPVLETQQENFRELNSKGGVRYIAPLLLVLGGLVIVYGLAMAILSRRASLGRAPWAIVIGVGLGVIAFVFVVKLFPRLQGGDEIIKAAKPAFTDERVAGDVAGIAFFSEFVDAADPIETRKGKGVAEVGKLVALVSKRSGLSQREVLGALRKEAPRTTALLTAIPLSDVAREVPHLVDVLSGALKLSDEAVVSTLKDQTPGLAQAITTVGPVTKGWRNVPDRDGATRFDGTPIQTARDVRDYFMQDAIPAVASVKDDFQELESTWPDVDVFPPLVLGIAIVVTLFGLLMFLRPPGPAPKPQARR